MNEYQAKWRFSNYFFQFVGMIIIVKDMLRYIAFSAKLAEWVNFEPIEFKLYKLCTGKLVEK